MKMVIELISIFPVETLRLTVSKILSQFQQTYIMERNIFEIHHTTAFYFMKLLLLVCLYGNI
jgi:hypothetical protein